MERRAIAIEGIVQGVGFRPFVYSVACALELGGFVKNQVGGVRIEVEGERDSLDRFISEVIHHPPPLARITEWSCEDRPARGERWFRIDASDSSAGGSVVITPDSATCDACLAELFDPGDRRYRYPFLNCTHCGPRLTIVTGAPYDRERTTMSKFAMCADCRREYENPADRRFHAQPNACRVCGPRLTLVDSGGHSLNGDDPLAAFVKAIVAGKIGAMKGLGGYHLVCDARNSAAILELRRRKHRDEKPFAIMVRDLAAAERICEVDAASRELLTSRQSPIILMQRRRDADPTLPGALAPANPMLGVMLPYTPLHHLVLHDLDGMPVVMTSGNRSDEPIAYGEPEAMERLAGVADVFLTHDRPIHVRCDDSVTRAVAGVESPVRRSRGQAPHPIALPMTCPQPMLAVGGQLKATFALGHDRRAIISHHLGDLDHLAAYRAFEKDVALYEELFAERPAIIAHDLHPDYASTRYTIGREEREGISRVAVQHHHAHMAACMAEHGLSGPVIGVTLDGTGYGLDGAIWGCEFLVGDYRRFRRAAHLRYVGLPGGEKAVREPWRMAAAQLQDAGASCRTFEARIDAAALRNVRQMLDRKFNTPLTSSAGRLFDAVASLAGIRDRVSYEGQAAMELEWRAEGSIEGEPYPFVWGDDIPIPPPSGRRDADPLVGSALADAGRRIMQSTASAEADPTTDGQSSIVIDPRPMFHEIAKEADKGVAAAIIAQRCHATMVEMIFTVCRRVRDETGINEVAFSGGVFMNAILAEAGYSRLTRDGFRVYRHHLVPTNDGGLCLGQLAVAASQSAAT